MEKSRTDYAMTRPGTPKKVNIPVSYLPVFTSDGFYQGSRIVELRTKQAALSPDVRLAASQERLLLEVFILCDYDTIPVRTKRPTDKPRHCY
jgi:hypothetical protein